MLALFTVLAKAPSGVRLELITAMSLTRVSDLPDVTVCGSVGSAFVNSTVSPLRMRIVSGKKRTMTRYCQPPPVATISPVIKQKGNANRATLAVARKRVAYLMAVDREINLKDYGLTSNTVLETGGILVGGSHYHAERAIRKNVNHSGRASKPQCDGKEDRFMTLDD
jgi:hypothetical protein